MGRHRLIRIAWLPTRTASGFQVHSAYVTQDGFFILHQEWGCEPRLLQTGALRSLAFERRGRQGPGSSPQQDPNCFRERWRRCSYGSRGTSPADHQSRNFHVLGSSATSRKALGSTADQYLVIRRITPRQSSNLTGFCK